MRKDLIEYKNNRVGEINISNEGYKMKIVEYNKAIDIWIEFQDEYKAKIHTTYNCFKNGEIKNPYHPRVFGVGYLGQGKHEPYTNGKSTRCYTTWQHMLRRCYSTRVLNTHPTYRNCIVCDEWLCFQNFAEWYYNNYYEIKGETMCLDKDILFKGNKIYSPKTCIFVPEKINTLFTKSDATRGEYPIGVSPDIRGNRLIAQCHTHKNDRNKSDYLGSFPLNKPFQAFTCYKNYKENYIKQVADEYKELIPQKLYEALCKYEVEIND